MVRYNGFMRKHVAFIQRGFMSVAILAVVGWAVACAQPGDAEPPVASPTPPAAPPTATPTPAPTMTATATPAPKATPTPPPPTVTATPRPTPRIIRTPTNDVKEPAPDFEIETFDGQALRLSDLEGKVVVLNFWASWCPPCRAEMPSFERSWQEYREQGVVFVGVAMSDTEEDARGFAEEVGVTYPIGLDTTNEVARAYEVRSLPTTFFIGKDGLIERRLGGAATEGILKIFIRGQLAKK